MAFFILTCLDKPGSGELRAATRERHLAYVREHLSMVKVAGPLLGEHDAPQGTMFVLEADGPEQVHDFAKSDPYAMAGLFGSIDVQAWRPTIGGFA